MDWKSHKTACKELGAMMLQGQEWEADIQQGASDFYSLHLDL
jgi:hypothetical protein